MVEFRIDGQIVEAAEGETVLEVARAHGIDIPTLCYHPAVTPYGACRLCLVEVDKGGRKKLTTACNYPVLEGISVVTQSAEINRQRQLVMELILARDPSNATLQEMATRVGLEWRRVRFESRNNCCILCGLCERVCREVIGADAISFAGRGIDRRLETPFDEASEACIGCLACVGVCPTGYITYEETDDTRTVWKRTFQLVRCKTCDKPLGTPDQLARFSKSSGLPDSYFDTCDDCRKAQSAAAFAAVVWPGGRS